MLYHKLHWGSQGETEFLLGEAPLYIPPLNRPCFLQLPIIRVYSYRVTQATTSVNEHELTLHADVNTRTLFTECYF